MLKAAVSSLALLGLALAVVARAQEIPGAVNLRFSEQISNGPAGSCGCFALEGAAGDVYWRFIGAGHSLSAGIAADAGVEHTGEESGASYGLTLTTVAAGPRIAFPAHRLKPFAQILFGLAHGSGSEFPQGNSLVPSANSFALELGGGADYTIVKHLSIRLVQADYLRTQLPNSTSNWQNNLRIAAGVTLIFGHS